MTEESHRNGSRALGLVCPEDEDAEHTEELSLLGLLPGQELYSSFDRLTATASVEAMAQRLPPGTPQETLPFEEDEVSELIAAGLRQVWEPVSGFATPKEHRSRAVDTDLENLERLYARHGLWEELVAILDRRIAVTDGEDRIVYMLELARLLEAQLGVVERAVAAYQRILVLAPTCDRAFARLVALFTRQGDWQSVLTTCEAHLARLVKPAERLPIFEAMADVFEHQLHQPAKAQAVALRAIVGDGPDPRLTRRLCRLASLTGSWADTMAQLSRGATSVQDPARQAELFCVMGAYYLERLDLPHHAVTCFGQAMLRYPRNPQAPTALVAAILTCLDRGRLTELCAILPRLELSILPRGFVDRLADTAEALRRRGDADGSLRLFRALHQLDGENESLFLSVAVGLEAKGQLEELVTLHRQRLHGTKAPDLRLARQLALADLLEHVLSDPGRSMNELMAALAERNYVDDVLGRRLARMAGTYDRWEELVSSSLANLGQLPDGRAKAGLCRMLGLWYIRHLQSAESAIPLLRSAILLEPEEVSTWLLLAEVHRTLGHYSEVAEALSEAAALEDDPLRKAAVFMDLGKVLEVQLQNKEGAIAAYTVCIELDPASRWASNALHRLCPDESHDRIIERAVASRLRLAATPRDAAALHLRLAELYASQKDRTSAAIDHCRAALDNDPNSEMALLLLERIYSKLSNYDAVVDTLKARLGRVTSPPLKVWLLLRIAEILGTHIHDSDRASEAYEQVLELEPQNEAALRALTETYRRSSRPADLARVLERLVILSRTEHRRLELLRELGRLYLHELRDLPRAGEVFGELGHIDTEDGEMLAALADTHERSGKLALAVEALVRLATVTREPWQRAAVLARIGQLCAERLHDDERAREYLEAAVELAPKESQYLESLESLERRNERWPRVAELLQKAIACPVSDDKRSERLVRLGDVLREHLGDEPSAVSCFEQARSLCPTNHEATSHLLDVYEARGSYDELEQCLRALVRSGLGSGPTLRSWYQRLANLYERRGDLRAALEAHQACYDINSRDTDSLLALADARFRAEQWDKALRLYSTAITDKRHGRGGHTLALAYYRAGVCQQVLAPNDARKAEGFFAKAVEYDPKWREAISAVVDSAKSRGDRARTAEYLSRLAEATEDADRKHALLLELAQLHEALQDPTAAQETLRLALEARPTDRATLERLATLLAAGRHWKEYASAMERLALLCRAPAERAEVLYNLALTMADKARNRRRAIYFLEKALDANPAMLRAFEKLDELLTRRKDWAELERAYVRMIRRVDEAADSLLASNLWQLLGEIYRTRLKNRAQAIEAFERAAHLRPGDPQLHLMLAEQYSLPPARTRDAELQLRWLVRENPVDVRVYEMLWSLYDRTGWSDEAYCASAPLVFLEAADERQRSVFEAGRSSMPDLGTARLRPQAWPDMLGDGAAFEPMVRLLESVTPSALSCASKPPRAYGLSSTQRGRVRRDVLAVSLFHRIADTLGIDESIELYLQPGDAGALSYVHTEPRASACPEGLLSSCTKAQLVFLLGRHLFYYPSRHYVRWLAPTRHGLETLLLSAIAAVDPLRLPAAARDSAAVRRLAESLRGQMNSSSRQRLNTAVEAFFLEGARIDVQGWMRHLELMSTRLGFVLCNDLFTAAQMSRADTGEQQLTSANEKIEDLLAFSVSAGHFALRRALGSVVSS